MNHLTSQEHYEISRRQTIKQLGAGLGGVILSTLLQEDAKAEPRIHNLTPRRPRHTPKAKAVIQLFMHGGPSQVDLLDPKPLLNNRGRR